MKPYNFQLRAKDAEQEIIKGVSKHFDEKSIHQFGQYCNSMISKCIYLIYLK